MASFRQILLTVTGALLLAAPARAQSSPDSVFARAKQLVVNGNGAAGRLLVDSVIAATPPGTPAYGDALYWRAALAASNADAERDYRRIVVEYSASRHSGDALLALSQIEIARGDRAAASTHMARFLAENPTSAERPRVSLQVVRLLFEQNDLARGCPILTTALAEVPPGSVELHNQLAYYSPRCVAADIGPGGRMPMPPGQRMPTASESSATGARAASGAAHDTATRAAAEKSTGKYTLQIAAYKSKADAEALVKRLKARKLEARVVGTKTFRVRIGRYATRAAAAAAQKELRARKIDGFVTEIGPDDK